MSNTNTPLSFKLGSGNLPTTNITQGAIYLKQNTNNNKYINFNLYYGTDNSTIIPLSIQWDNIADKPIATTTTNGLMSSADKAKLEGIAIGANNYSLPTASSNTLGGIKIGYTQSNKNYPVQLDSNKKAYVNVPWTDTNTTYTNATTSSSGLMSSADKTKLDNTNIAYATCSTNAAVANKVITIQNNNNWTLKTGSFITVFFDNTNTADNPTFNVNNTGAKSVYYNSNVIATTSKNRAGSKGRPCTYVYNGTYYCFAGWGYDGNTTYSVATTTADGLMSSDDKDKLDNIATMTGATASKDGTSGLVPLPTKSNRNKFLKGDGTWSVLIGDYGFDPPTTTGSVGQIYF